MRFWELVYHVCLSSFASIIWALSLACISNGAWLRLKHLNWSALRFHPPAFLSKAVRRLLYIGEGVGLNCKVPLSQLLVLDVPQGANHNGTCGTKEVWVLETMDAMRLRVSSGILRAVVTVTPRHGY